jgi:hypothetical protein
LWLTKESPDDPVNARLIPQPLLFRSSETIRQSL